MGKHREIIRTFPAFFCLRIRSWLCSLDDFFADLIVTFDFGAPTEIELVGGLEHFLFSHIFGIIIPVDFHIFQGGWSTTNL